MELSNPVFAQYFELHDFALALLGKQEREQIGVDIDEGCVNSRNEARHFDELVDDLDILDDGSLRFVLVNALVDRMHQLL